MRTFTKAIVTIGSVAALTAGAAFSVSANDEDAIKYRQSVMKAQGGHIAAAVAIIKGKVPYKDDLVAHVKGLNETASTVANAFKEKTTGGDTRAKAEIWEDPADFQKKIEDLQAATAAFLAAAESGGVQAAGDKLGAVGDACGACHKKYREKQS